MSYTGSGKVSVSFSHEMLMPFGLNTSGVSDYVTRNVLKSFTYDATPAAAGEFDKVVHLAFSAVADAVTIDLFAGTYQIGAGAVVPFEDARGDAVTFSAVRSFVISTDKSLALAPAVANGWTAITHTTDLASVLAFASGSTAGWAVAAANRYLVITPAAAAAFDIHIIGVS